MFGFLKNFFFATPLIVFTGLKWASPLFPAGFRVFLFPTHFSFFFLFVGLSRPMTNYVELKTVEHLDGRCLFIFARLARSFRSSSFKMTSQQVTIMWKMFKDFNRMQSNQRADNLCCSSFYSMTITFAIFY